VVFQDARIVAAPLPELADAHLTLRDRHPFDAAAHVDRRARAVRRALAECVDAHLLALVVPFQAQAELGAARGVRLHGAAPQLDAPLDLLALGGGGARENWSATKTTVVSFSALTEARSGRRGAAPSRG
jgi:hypothetical protein